MPSLSPARILLSLAPALVLVALAANVVWGAGGLIERYRLKERKAALAAEISAINTENARAQRELRLLSEEPLAVQREAAERLGVAAPGAVIYAFEE